MWNGDCEEIVKKGDVVIKPFRHSWMQIIKETGAGRVAEIGVCYGLMASIVLSKFPQLKEYWAIDPWSVEYASEPSLMKMSAEEWDAWHSQVVALCGDFNNLRVLRMASCTAAKQFSDGYFDTVFLDGNHYYEAVLADIEAWLPKIAADGALCGHDYHFATVRKAVIKKLGNVEIMPGDVWTWRNRDKK
jgi:predicted O-methyltransferase YrrM